MNPWAWSFFRVVWVSYVRFIIRYSNMTVVHIIILYRQCLFFGTCDVIMSLFSLHLWIWPPSAEKSKYMSTIQCYTYDDHSMVMHIFFHNNILDFYLLWENQWKYVIFWYVTHLTYLQLDTCNIDWPGFFKTWHTLLFYHLCQPCCYNDITSQRKHTV